MTEVHLHRTAWFKKPYYAVSILNSIYIPFLYKNPSKSIVAPKIDIFT